MIYSWLMFLTTLRLRVFTYMSLILLNFFLHPYYHGKQSLKRQKVKLNLLADTDMLMIVEKKTLKVENVMLFFDMQNPTKNT